MTVRGRELIVFALTAFVSMSGVIATTASSVGRPTGSKRLTADRAAGLLRYRMAEPQRNRANILFACITWMRDKAAGR